MILAIEVILSTIMLFLN